MIRTDRCVSFAAVLALLIGLTAVSCSVKEDRSFCPFELVVSMSLSARPDVSGDSVEVAVCNTTCDRTARIPFSESERGRRSFDVERGRFTVCGVFNRSSQMLDIPSRTVMIPSGMQSDSIYAFSYNFDFEDERMVVHPELHKQWATLVLIAGTGGSGSSFFEKFEVRVASDTGGFDMVTLGGIPGPFEYTLYSDCDRAAVRLPRQCGNGLELQIVERASGSEVLRSSLSTRLEVLGYDWSAPDLEDICLVISEMADCTFELKIRQWSIFDMGEIQL